MKYKLIIMCIALVTLFSGCKGTFISCGAGEDEKAADEWIEQLFYIGDVEYEVVNEANGLDPKEYGGSYRVELKVDKDNSLEFIAKIEENYYIPEDIECYRNPIMNVYGQELGEGDTFYYNIGAVRRTIKDADMIPKTCRFYIICSQQENGELYVILEYTE